MIRFLRQLIAAITVRLAARKLQRTLPRANPLAAAVLDLDYLARARSRSRVRMACQANDLDDATTAQLIKLFDNRWVLSCERGEPASERETSVTQDCIERAAACARERMQQVHAAPDFAKV